MSSEVKGGSRLAVLKPQALLRSELARLARSSQHKQQKCREQSHRRQRGRESRQRESHSSSPNITTTSTHLNTTPPLPPPPTTTTVSALIHCAATSLRLSFSILRPCSSRSPPARPFAALPFHPAFNAPQLPAQPCSSSASGKEEATRPRLV